MEVHHHTHTERKKWHHYLWEFLMLFLAVFCGFLAENKREHFIELKKEKQYISSLVRDIKADTSMLHGMQKRYEIANKMVDTLIRLLKSNERNLKSCKIYNLARTITFSYGTLVPEDQTLQQLKNSGNLRLIHNSQIVDRIGSYYQLYTALNNGGPGQLLFQYRHDVSLFTPELFDMLVFDKMFLSDSLFIQFHDLDSCREKTVLLTNDPVIINKICGSYFYLRVAAKAIMTLWIPRMLGKTDSLLANIKKEYHLE
jgi:hypothetical protein